MALKQTASFGRLVEKTRLYQFPCQTALVNTLSASKSIIPCVFREKSTEIATNNENRKAICYNNTHVFVYLGLPQWKTVSSL